MYNDRQNQLKLPPMDYRHCRVGDDLALVLHVDVSVATSCRVGLVYQNIFYYLSPLEGMLWNS